MVGHSAFAARRREILAQRSAMKEVYGAGQETVNPHKIVRGLDCWHLFLWAGTELSELREAARDVEPLQGLCLGGIVWSEGVPVPVDLRNVLEETG